MSDTNAIYANIFIITVINKSLTCIIYAGSRHRGCHWPKAVLSRSEARMDAAVARWRQQDPRSSRG